jgi:hypothetical protein
MLPEISESDPGLPQLLAMVSTTIILVFYKHIIEFNLLIPTISDMVPTVQGLQIMPAGFIFALGKNFKL